ncbi:MAG: MBL fold metallo-hydrolase [Bacteroidetes bacterium]|nr:MAG: MBL fold metallo-hydrolase [Bacteroidota bacterium]
MLIWLPVAIIVLWITPRIVIRLNPNFGGAFSGDLNQKFSRSKQWDGKAFQNIVPVSMVKLSNAPGLLRERFSNNNIKEPEKPLPIKRLDHNKWDTMPEKPKFVWYGHATLLLQINGKNLLIDPMFGPIASPFSFMGIKRFSKNTLDLIDDLPPIDAVLISHDHYDHLDLKSIEKLKGRIENWFVALGVGRHLEKWGVNSRDIQELDWWQEIQFEGINITFTPSQHFSGRGLSDRFKSFWGGFVFQTQDHSIYWNGDGGYGTHFREIGEKFGSFDWAFMECGQYNDLWHQLHLFPEESVLAAIDAGAKKAIPVHWGAFALAMHSWKDPIDRFVAEAKKHKFAICTPDLGDVVVLGQEPEENEWWKKVK